MDVSRALIEHVAKHFVLLVCWQSIGTERNLVKASGFVVEVEGHWLLVTAAHTIEDCRTAQRKGARFDNWRLCDSIIDKQPLLALPLPCGLNDWVTLGGEGDSAGHDYAFLFIPDLVMFGLKQGGTRPIESIAWEGIAPLECDQWVMLGVPDEPDKDIPRLSMLLLQPCGPPAGTVAAESANICFGHLSTLEIDGGEPVRNIGGMSGGPVFGVKMLEGAIRYWAIGIQSGWYEKHRVAVFCLLQGFLAELRRIVQRMTADFYDGRTRDMP